MASTGVVSNTISVGSEIVVLERVLGKGAFGVVYKARNQRGREYALKDIACSGGTCANELAEIGMLRQVSHQNIVQIIASGERIENGVRHILILTEFCSGGNLNERLNRPNSSGLALKWLKQLASALSYLHDRNIVHRDLKPENVLLTDRSNEDIKIGDFGLARQFVALIQGPSLADDWINHYMKTFAGSPPWMAPEVFNGHYTEKADVFSLGCIFYAILVRQYNTYGDGKRYYGAFVSFMGSTMPLGHAMAQTRDSNLMVAFPAAIASTPKIKVDHHCRAAIRPKHPPNRKNPSRRRVRAVARRHCHSSAHTLTAELYEGDRDFDLLRHWKTVT